MWHINTEPPADSTVSFNAKSDDKWWDQVDLVKLILADNHIKEIPNDVGLLTALTLLDVSTHTRYTQPFSGEVTFVGISAPSVRVLTLYLMWRL